MHPVKATQSKEMDREMDRSDDELSTNDSSVQEYTPGCFEGPEKTLEVVFYPTEGLGLRSLTRTQIDHLCTKAHCTILHHISNAHMDAFILSESSLFIMSNRLVIKTCGTTTLLRCLGTLLRYGDELGMVLEWVGYSRKNLNNPSAQAWPHSSFPDEVSYMSTHPSLQSRLQGSAHILGPVTGDHWYVYIADVGRNCNAMGIPRPITPNTERTINLMMFDMAPTVGEVFFLENTPNAKEMTRKVGIDTLCEGATIDETAFTPCGYSMNAIGGANYTTIHITPEPLCSYASYETTQSFDCYRALVQKVLGVFQPKRYVLTLMGDEEAIDCMERLPTEKTVQAGELVYCRTATSTAKVDADLACVMACYTLQG